MRLLTLLAGARDGGAETFFVTLSGAFVRSGHDVHAIIRHNPPRAAALRDAGVRVTETAFGRWLDFQTGRAIDRAIAQLQPQAALSFMSRASAFMPRGPFPKVARLGGFYDLKYFRRCDHLACITEGIRRHVIDLGWPAGRASVIANFAEPDASPPADRAALGTPADAPVVFTPARLHQAKALDVLLKAVARLDGVYLWIAGSGPEETALKTLARELGVADRVVFLGWQAETGAYFRSCDVVAFPSRHEPFGTVTLEAWAYGKPLVVSDADGPAEFVTPEVDALMVPRDAIEPLAEALRRAIEDKDLAARLVAGATERHGRHFTREACVRSYVDLFERLSAA
ncbi:MAG: glycosyltransferase [Alphaproteobacteria bacterium]|nr:glycosyltransferase [Alphaproteobacteria bacterium]